MDSPPKRVTRARAAAKKDDAPKTTKIATAASKAKATRTTATVTTKRKTRTDEEKDGEDQQNEVDHIIEPEITAPVKTTRGRPKKTAVQEEEMMNAPPVKATRGRATTAEVEQTEEAPVPAKTTRGRAAHTEPEHTEEVPAPAKTTRGRPKKAVVETPAAELARATRGRAKKIEVPEEETIAVEEPAKRATRGRAGTLTKATAPKKSVKFEEPDKENIVPLAAKSKPKAVEVGTGLRAKPVRKPTTTTTRATRGRAKTEKTEGSSPLSPKKVTQVGATVKGAESDDELSTNIKTPLKPLMKSPVKPPGSIFNAAKKLDFSASNSITVNRMTTQDLSGSVMASSARRPRQSPFKESIEPSPQRSTFQGSMLQSPFKPSFPAAKAVSQTPSFKASLLQSPARRPVSPTKVDDAGSPSRVENKSSLFGATPKASPFKISRFTTPRTLNINKSVSRAGQMMPPPTAPSKFATGSPKGSQQDDDSTLRAEPMLKFSGRLSSIMPRSADPALAASEPITEETEQAEETAEQMDIDQVETIVVEDPVDVNTITLPCSSLRNSVGSFELRVRDESPFDDSGSEDELASGSPKYSPIPLSGFNVSAHDFASSPVQFEAITTPKSAKSARPSFAAMRSDTEEKIGFTPLATQLSNWMAASPERSKSATSTEELVSHTATPIKQTIDVRITDEQSPAKSTFFDDEMSVRDEVAAAPEPESIQPEIEQDFGPVEIDEEDLALANEADEMSLLKPDQLAAHDEADMFEISEPEQVCIAELEVAEQPQISGPEFSELLQIIEPKIVELVPEAQKDQSFEQALSEASQEYGDENAIPIDPALFELQSPPAPSAPIYSTPQRVLSERTFHTVSKVPLKAAAEDSPMRPSPMKRSASISRLPVQRPTTSLTRKNTVISYSPTKSTPRFKKSQAIDASPSKGDWSTVGTPARTPRRDLNTALLKGAVVFVDVHTTEGADASVLFTELLTQMGARCVKTWNWNGNGEDGSKIGITHVVFKDGGKRTLEKARETDGVVSCVGVGWVLDCERENQWLPESPYTVDTAMVPRGGQRRRKSMEPRALANLNGTLVPSTTPSRSTSLSMSPGTPLTSKARRRDSVQWVRSSPASSSTSDPAQMNDFLSPVPATPAPEMISAYGEEGLYGQGETPVGQTPYFLHKEQLMQQTAPVKRFEEVVGEGESGMGMSWLSENKDESVMMRLMAARRKSLQWAPKVGSPLAKGEGWRSGLN